MEAPCRVVIAEDDTIVRDYLGAVLASDRNFEVAGLARDGAEALALVAEKRPDLVILDLVMPRMDGLTAARRIRALSQDTKIAILTGSEDEDSVFSCIEAGAGAYLLKTSGREEILSALRALAAGQPNMSGAPLQQLLSEFRRLRSLRAPSQALPPDLTDREVEALRYIAGGLSNKEIAVRMGVAISTVKSHLNRAFEKLHVQDRTQAALLVERHGWFRV